MNKKIISSLLFIIFSLLLISCGTSTSGRYETSENKKEVKEEKKAETKNDFKEDFDLTPYHALINVKEKNKTTKPEKELDIWYDYKSKTVSDTANPQIINQVNGYRVQVFSTDNLEEADSIRTEISSRTNQKEVYISFEPPFYKVKVGDFLKISDAKDLSFKLNQIGYTEARVINDKVNVFSK